VRALFFFVLAAACTRAAAVSIALEGDPPVVRVAAARGTVTLRVDRPDAPALRGTLTARDGALVFTPRYPLQAGLAYRVRHEDGASHTEAVVTPAGPGAPSTLVEGIFPSAAEWPENTLRFYLHFSAPMSRAEAFARMHLIDAADNREVGQPFLEIHEELWDRGQRRLTVLFDPGRVKRGLVPHHDVGPPLVAGRRYRLTVDAAWRDGRNQPLARGFAKEFTAVAAVRSGIALSTWKIQAPPTGTRDPLVIDFGRALDSGITPRALDVPGVNGTARLDAQESRWLFTPDEAWQARDYQLQINRALEDIAGNRLGRAFDVELDVFDRVKPPASAASESLTFRPRP